MKPGAALKKQMGLLTDSHGMLKAQMLDTLMHMPGLLVVVTNAHFELLTANEYFYTYFACAPSDLLGKALFDFLGDDHYHDMNAAHIERILREGHVWDYKARTLMPDGTPVSINWNHAVFQEPHGQPLILSMGMAPAITEAITDTETTAAPHPLAQPVPVLQSQNQTQAQTQIQAPSQPLYHPPVSEEDIRDALANRLFTLYYQPIMHMRTKKIAGVEVLMRMKHPVHGLLPPDAFLKVAEASGQIVDIGVFVLNHACKRLKRWSDITPPLFLSVNISARQFMDGAFPKAVLNAITRNDIAAGLLTVEVTEDTAYQNLNQTKEVIRVLHGMGCRVSLDKFGTGFTSLRLLADLEIDNLKIAREFFSGAIIHKTSEAVMESVIVLAHGLGMTVTCEGVESQLQLEFMLDKACDYLQGYLFSHPFPELEFDRLLREDPDFYLRNS